MSIKILKRYIIKILYKYLIGENIKKNYIVYNLFLLQLGCLWKETTHHSKQPDITGHYRKFQNHLVDGCFAVALYAERWGLDSV